jgi:hypothetical protein
MSEDDTEKVEAVDEIKAGDLVRYIGGHTAIDLNEQSRVEDITGVQGVAFALVRFGGKSYRIPTAGLKRIHEVRLVEDELTALRQRVAELEAALKGGAK